MSGHLPECLQTDGDCPCICDRLRACEARVREETIVSYDMKRAEQAERNGYAAALDAARDAVAAECIAHHGYTPGQTCPYCTDALAAIDALLKEKP